jgi:hypothetical protein
MPSAIARWHRNRITAAKYALKAVEPVKSRPDVGKNVVGQRDCC